MQSMRKTIYAGIITAFFCSFLWSCTTTYSIYSKNLFTGKQLLKEEEYAEASRHFQNAILQMRDSVSLTFMAVAEYKMGNLENAEKWIREAEREKPDIQYIVRTFGYRAIIYMKRNKAAGMEALKDYVDRYQHFYPLETIKVLQRMVRTGNIDEKMMEKIIDEQISWYETEMEEYLTNNVGFIADKNRIFFID